MKEHSLIGSWDDGASYRPGKLVTLPVGTVDRITHTLSVLSGPSTLYKLASGDTLRVFWQG